MKWSVIVKKSSIALPKKLHLIWLLVLVLLQATHGQTTITADSNQVHKGRLIGVSSLAATAYIGGMTGLYYLWYQGYERSSFHTINDSKAWLQVDKFGHTFSTYQMSRVAYVAFDWAGLNSKQTMWLSSAYGFVFFTTVEIFDGHSANWGWSWSDIAANAAGTGFFLGQQLLWKEQRMQLKFSYAPSEYAQYNPHVLGSNGIERILKDYNAQTYWLSINPQSFTSHRIFPKFLNIAIGYGAKGMINTYNNPKTINGEAIPHFKRTRQYYLSLDVDLTKIKTKSEFLRLLFSFANMIKVPLPALEYNSENGFVFHPIYF